MAPWRRTPQNDNPGPRQPRLTGGDHQAWLDWASLRRRPRTRRWDPDLDYSQYWELELDRKDWEREQDFRDMREED